MSNSVQNPAALWKLPGCISFSLVLTLSLLVLIAPCAFAQESASSSDSANKAPDRWSRPQISAVTGSTGSRWDNGYVPERGGTALTGEAVKITVDASKKVSFMMPWALGANASLDDGLLINPDTIKMLTASGFTTLRYPSRDADAYHWSLYKSNRRGLGDGPYLAPNNDVGSLAFLLANYWQGTVIFTVNYGSNLQGTGGGEPAEAAAWVAYVNGNPADPKVIGKDSTGYDWKTVGYWATMRASKPLADDDGYNFLRIATPAPLNIVYWEIGNELYSSGFYGEKTKYNPPETDFHAGYGNSAADSFKERNGNAALSPTAFGKNAAAFIKAMKDVDSNIHVGVPLLSPGIDAGFVPDWNAGVLKEVGPLVDFVSARFQSIRTLPPDWQNVDESATLGSAQGTTHDMIGGLTEQVEKFGGKRITKPQILVTDFSIPSWVKFANPVVPALFTADAYSSLIQFGAVSIDWDSLHSKTLLNDNVQADLGTNYYGIQMVHLMMGIKDAVLESHTSNSMITVHAARNKDGSVSIMLINKDPKTTGTAKIAVAGASLADTGVRFDYGQKVPDGAYPVTRSELTGIGNNFTVQVAPYTITVIKVKAR